MLFTEIAHLNHTFSPVEGLSQHRIQKIVSTIQRMMIDDLLHTVPQSDEEQQLCFLEIENLTNEAFDEIERVITAYNGNFFKFTVAFAEPVSKALVIVTWI